MADKPTPTDADTDAQHICCTLTSVVLRVVRSGCGSSGVRRVLAEAGSRRDESFLEDVANWVSNDEAVALLGAGARVTEDPSFATRVGELAVRQHAGTPVASLLRSLGSPEAVLQGITATAAKFSTITDMQPLEVGPGRALVRARARSGFDRPKLLCQWTTGLLSQPPVLFGLPPAHVRETACQARGGPHCLYEVTWDADLAGAAADPEQRLIAVEAQLAAMSERLEGAFATASDLVSPEDVATVLERILERAAHAVRAPGYVLAIRNPQAGEPDVFSRGIAAARAADMARAAMEGQDVGRSALDVPVASSRREYGRLLALYPAGQAFFPAESQLLRLYAKHAAAVLDMATALEAADRRHEQASALLSLSRSIAHAGTGRELARRLAEAVPRVVDCDRMGIWLWDASAAGLRSAGSFGFDAAQTSLLEGLTIRPSETPSLRRAMVEHEPMFFDSTSNDPYMTALLQRLGLLVTCVIPIIARDEFVGVLTVSVSDRPERLRPTRDLLERLTGVAGLAAPALQNGQLVDKLTYDAAHDPLTGLLNRAGFAERVASALNADAADADRLGLLFIDLDDFKRVNDDHGHDAGDEVLRQTAERLALTLRDADGIARLGGDEFAAILSGIRTYDQVRAASRRVRSALSKQFRCGDAAFRVTASVGEAIWPDDGRTVDALIKHADAEMYRCKAGRARA